MKLYSLTFTLLACSVCFATAGCQAPGRPVQAEAAHPDDVLDFPALYRQNCSACHGESGRRGATISLANPVYLAIAGTGNIQRVTAAGVAGTSMPPFGRPAGGMLTDRQIAVVADGIVHAWGHPEAVAGQSPPPYASSSTGDTAKGQMVYATFCARCHGTDGAGMNNGKTMRTGSIVDPTYLALVSDQYLRSTILAGRPEEVMPDWRSDLAEPHARPMTDQEITDTVAWIASHRIAVPGEPYPQHP
jgi:mono/diheme cytochrome c family protein